MTPSPSTINHQPLTANSPGIRITGLGAVSPAGWSVAALRETLGRGEPLPVSQLTRPGRPEPFNVRLAPPPHPRPACFAHPRLRRASPITQYATAAALEALAADTATHGYPARLGLILCLQSGCVIYSQRFFQEVLDDPATASPLLFPETVFAAPASHVAAVLPNIASVTTLLGDPSTILNGISLAADWLMEARVDACLVVGAEETNWLLADALWHFDHHAILSGGAGALCLRADRGRKTEDGGQTTESDILHSKICILHSITSPHPFSTFSRADASAKAGARPRIEAARRMRQELPPGEPTELLCDGRQNRPRSDALEQQIWHDWPGPRLSPKTILGEGLMAAAAWQCVAACDALAQGRHPAATVSLLSGNQQAQAARFTQMQRMQIAE